MAAEKLTIIGVIKKKTAKGGILLEEVEGWFGANFPPAKPKLADIAEGTRVKLTYVVKGIYKNVTDIELSVSGDAAPAPAPATTGYKCSECGAALKDGKYKKCYDCNQKAKNPAAAPAQTPAATPTPAPAPETPQKRLCGCGAEIKGDFATCYTCSMKAESNPEKVERIMRGNAINAAAAAMNGISTKPEEVIQATLAAAQRFLDFIKQ